MKVLVDADACPVKEIILRVAKEYGLKVLMFIDTSHELSDSYAEIITVDKGRDSVDIALANKTAGGDLVITQDYGVAAVTLSKGAYALNQNGLIYTQENIDRLLFERFLSQKVRRSGGRTSNPGKRTREDNEKFEKAMRQLCRHRSG